MGRILKVPVTEIYAPMGAKLSPNPRMKWQRYVILLARLYPRITKRATGDRIRVRRLINPEVTIKNTEFIITNRAADRGPILPDGNSLLSVLGFSESIFLSARRLKPIAAFLAKIMQRIIRIRSLKLNVYSFPDTANANPIMAKGMAKTVWRNFTSEK